MARHPGIVIAVLSWNLAHGRDFPPDRSLGGWRSRLFRTTERGETHAQVNRPLRHEFCDWLASREWELALLQEVPPRWQDDLAERTGASVAVTLTSRNSFGRLRAAAAELNPDLIASNEGGSNQLLVRPPARVVDVRCLTLTERPERRRMLWALVATPDGRRLGVANLHASAGDPAAAARDVRLAAERARAWSGPSPFLFGGDLNLRPREDPATFAELGLREPTAPDAIDHLLTGGLEIVRPGVRLAPEERDVPGPDGLRIRLSDHAPVVASFGMK
ncbi:MAG TPA: endonuclease/exonuclease/phosphatase family protein [Thermoleophilaceae bacterium]